MCVCMNTCECHCNASQKDRNGWWREHLSSQGQWESPRNHSIRKCISISPAQHPGLPLSNLSRPPPRQPSSWTPERHGHPPTAASRKQLPGPETVSLLSKPLSWRKSSPCADFPPAMPTVKGGRERQRPKIWILWDCEKPLPSLFQKYLTTLL